MKQNPGYIVIVQGYEGLMKYVYPISRIFSLFSYPTLPKPGSELSFFTLSFWAVKDNDPDIFKIFINYIASSIKGYPFFLVGVHQNNPLRAVLIKIPHSSYTSKVYLVNWEKKKSIIEDIDVNSNPYFECSTL